MLVPLPLHQRRGGELPPPSTGMVQACGGVLVGYVTHLLGEILLVFPLSCKPVKTTRGHEQETAALDHARALSIEAKQQLQQLHDQADSNLSAEVALRKGIELQLKAASDRLQVRGIVEKAKTSSQGLHEPACIISSGQVQGLVVDSCIGESNKVIALCPRYQFNIEHRLIICCTCRKSCKGGCRGQSKHD